MTGVHHFAALACLLDEGVGLLVGTCDPSGTPRAGRAWGVREDGDTLRVVIGADDPTLLANLQGRVVAVTGADVRRLRSAQLKGEAIAIVEPDEDDLAVADEQTHAFLMAILDTDRTEYELTSRMLPRRMLTVVLRVNEGFDQTPGPSAGSPLVEAT